MSLAGKLKIPDPIAFAKELWPHVTFYDKQREIIYSVHENDETFVPAGNMLGKDFVSAFIVLWFFLSRSPCKILTTSADHAQLQSVLWGEMGRFINECKYPLRQDKGGPLIVNDQRIRKILNPGTKDAMICTNSYILGRVAKKGEGMLGHHVADVGDGVARTMMLFDEGSGIEDDPYEVTRTWAKKTLVIGNPYPCTNFFYKGVKAGDLKAPYGKRYYRKVIKICAEDSPNVKYGIAQQQAGMMPTGEVILPGVLPYDEYVKRRTTWDIIRQTISLDANFYEGAEVLLFPPAWLSRAVALHAQCPSRLRVAKAIGIDPAEGGDRTSLAAVDDLGLIDLESHHTYDTSAIIRLACAFMLKHQVPPEKVFMDQGGGGKQIADMMRSKGLKVQTVPFGAAPTMVLRRGMRPLTEQAEFREHRYVYTNKRAEMYGELHMKMDPSNFNQPLGFALPGSSHGPTYDELLRQLALMPKLYDKEGRLYMLPKRKKPNSKEPCLEDILGCSPDEADALVLAVYGLTAKTAKRRVGAMR